MLGIDFAVASSSQSIDVIELDSDGGESVNGGDDKVDEMRTKTLLTLKDRNRFFKGIAKSRQLFENFSMSNENTIDSFCKLENDLKQNKIY